MQPLWWESLPMGEAMHVSGQKVYGKSMYLPLRFFFFCLFFHVFIGVQLIYNVVLVSGEQQSESVIHRHISTLFLDYFPIQAITEYCIPCAKQQFLISYLFYIQQCVYVSPYLPIYPFPPSSQFCCEPKTAPEMKFIKI